MPGMQVKTQYVFLIINRNIPTPYRDLCRQAPGRMTEQAQVVSQNSLKVETTQVSIDNRIDK